MLGRRQPIVAVERERGRGNVEREVSWFNPSLSGTFG